MLAYITGTVDQELLLRNDLAAENRILRAQTKGRLCLSQAEKATLAEIAHRLGRKALAEVAVAAKPDTILGWFRKLVARKFDGWRLRRSLGRPGVDEAVEDLVVQMAQENPTWGYDRPGPQSLSPHAPHDVVFHRRTPGRTMPAEGTRHRQSAHDDSH
jgi:putative transposase